MSAIIDVLRLLLNKLLRFSLIVFTLFSLSCHNKSQSDDYVIPTEVLPQVNTVFFPKVMLRLENEKNNESKLALLNFKFYVSELSSEDFETQKGEIKNLILIHFANSEFKKIPTKDSKIKDPKLSEYLNQFLSKGKIEDSEYELVRVF